MLIRLFTPAAHSDKSEYRLLYVGQDVKWFRRLKSVLGLPANRLVYSGGGSCAELLLKGAIRYDLFVLDLDPLNEAGLELIRLVRSLPHRKQTPIMIVTGHAVLGGLKDFAGSAGANECVRKTGDDVSSVAEIIQRLLSSARASAPVER